MKHRMKYGRSLQLNVESLEARALLAATPLDKSYVNEVFRDALGRSATPAEIARFTQAGVKTTDVTSAVFRSAEYRSALVQANYKRYLNVQPDAQGQKFWETQLRRGATEQTVIIGFLTSAAYRARSGGTAQGFVNGLYRDLLGRRPETSGSSTWTGALAQGASTTRVVRSFLQSPEFLGREVKLTTKGLLGRSATSVEVTAGVRSLRDDRDLMSYRRTVASGTEYLAQISAPPRAATLLDDTIVPNLARLGYFNGTTFVPVKAGSIGDTITGQGGTHLYVISHGWAPGYREIVDANSKPGDPIDWWQLQGAIVGTLGSYSPSLYQGTQGGEPYVTPLGLAQTIRNFDPKAVVLAYSWVDDSATDGGYTGLLDANESEARTQVNGLRMAGAIENAISTNFIANGGQIHLLGHSHGTKVATVAAGELIRVGTPVTQLTVFDSPDDDLTDLGNASNLLWYYLPNVNPTRTPAKGGTFVDSYDSEFSTPYAVYPKLNPVVDVTLDPSVIYSFDDLGDKHGYAPYWYAGASQVGQLASPPPNVGLSWSPLINQDAAKSLAAETSQTWTKAGQPQFVLKTTQQTVTTSETPTFEPLSYEQTGSSGNVTVTSQGITLRETGSSSVYTGKVYPEFDVDGITFDATFTAIGDGDQLIVSVAGNNVFYLDGLSAGTTTRSIAVSLGGLISDGCFGHDLSITLASNGSSVGSAVTVRNFQEFKIEAS